MTTQTTTKRQRSLFDDGRADFFSDLIATLEISTREPGWPDAFGRQLHEWAHQTIRRRPVTLSLFSGAGGLDIGFHDAGFRVIEMVELEKQFAATLELNAEDGGYFGPATVHCADIREFHPSDSLTVDFIVGGPPCQSFSAAGRRASGVTGINDSRGTLFEEYVRLLKQLKPRGFLFENVYGITGANQGKAWREIQRGFEDAGYLISSRILDTADYGVPQHRERVFIVGSRDRSFSFPRPTHGPDNVSARAFYSSGLAVKNAPGNLPAAGVNGRYGALLDEVPPGLNYSFFTEKLGHPRPVFAWRSKFSDFLYKADPEVPVRTIKAQGGQYTGPFHWGSRPFSTNELKRLQTFPDSYEISGGRQSVIHQIGNSVPPQVARCLALAILDQLFDVQLPAQIDYLRPDEQLGFRTRKRLLTRVYQEKARVALAGSANGVASSAAPKLKRRRLTRILDTNDFSWSPPGSRLPNSARYYACTIKPLSREWVVAIEQDDLQPRFNCTIELQRSMTASTWNLPVDSIRLEVNAGNSYGLTAAWRCLEEQLAQQHIRADLVQLIGYFQYVPEVRCVWAQKTASRSKIASLLQAVTEGLGVRRTIMEQELACEWNMDVDSIPLACDALRRLGFEVRNRNTNPEIPPGHYLVPYPFPTLTPKSVQLRKTLSLEGARRGWRL